MKLFVIRHTKVGVKAGVCYGQADVGLANSFQQEKQVIANELATVTFNKVFSSPLFRCQVLASGLFSEHSVVFDNRLKELNFGDWEMKTWDAIYANAQGKKWLEDYQSLSTPNGESYPEMVSRVTDFYNELLLGNFNKVAVVTHAGVIRILKSIIEKQPIDKLFETFKPNYGEIIEFEI